MLFSKFSGFDPEILLKLPANDRRKLELFSALAFIGIVLCCLSAGYFIRVTTGSIFFAVLGSFTVALTFYGIQSVLNTLRSHPISLNYPVVQGLKASRLKVLMYLALTLLFTQPILLYIDHYFYKDQIPEIYKLEQELRLQNFDNIHLANESQQKFVLANLREKITQLGGNLTQFIDPKNDVLLAVNVNSSLANSSPAEIQLASSPRKALVIGNKTYAPPGTTLFNPINDAKAIKQKLEKMGFVVTLVTESNYADMLFKINQYIDSVKPGDISVFFYSGHGNQNQGVNYIYSTDNNGVAINPIMQRLLDKKVLANITIIDACRVTNNPRDKGFAAQGAGLNSFIALAADAGEMSLDGNPKNPRNGMYTAVVLRHIGDLKGINDVFYRIGEEVKSDSGGGQHPIYIDHLQTKLVLASIDAGSSPTMLAANDANPGQVQTKGCSGNLAKNADSKAQLKDCVANYLLINDNIRQGNELFKTERQKQAELLASRFNDDRYNPMYLLSYIWSNSHPSEQNDDGIKPVYKAILWTLFIWIILSFGFVVREYLLDTLHQFYLLRNEEEVQQLQAHYHHASAEAKNAYRNYLVRLKETHPLAATPSNLEPLLPDPFSTENAASMRQMKYIRSGDEAFNHLMITLQRKDSE